MTSLYRFYSDSVQLLYVGITARLPRRLREHSGSKNWWIEVHSITVEHYAERHLARDAELRAIRSERPAYNIADVPDDRERFWDDRVSSGWNLICANEPSMAGFVELVRDIGECWSDDWCAVGWWMGHDHLQRLLQALVGWERLSPHGDEYLRTSEAYDVAWSVLYWRSTPDCNHDGECVAVSAEAVEGAVRSLAPAHLRDLWQRASELRVIA